MARAGCLCECFNDTDRSIDGCFSHSSCSCFSSDWRFGCNTSAHWWMADSISSGRLISSLPLKLHEEQITLEAILERVQSTLTLARDWKSGQWRSEESSSFMNKTTTTTVIGSRYGRDGRQLQEDDDATVDLTTYEEIVTRAKRERDTILSEVRDERRGESPMYVAALACIQFCLSVLSHPRPPRSKRPRSTSLRPAPTSSRRSRTSPGSKRSD